MSELWRKREVLCRRLEELSHQAGMIRRPDPVGRPLHPISRLITDDGYLTLQRSTRSRKPSSEHIVDSLVQHGYLVRQVLDMAAGEGRESRGASPPMRR